MARVGVANSSIDKLDPAASVSGSDRLVVSQGSPEIPEKRLTATQLNAFISANIDHGALLGLGDDDHPQYSQKPINVVEIEKMSDFPAPVAGVITLVASTTYLILKSVTISDRFVIPTGSTVNFETGTFNVGIVLIYTGSGTLFTGTNITAFQVFETAIIATGGGTLYDISAGASNFPLITWFRCLAVGFASIGTVTNSVYVAHFSAHVDCAMGLTLADPINMSIDSGAYFNTSDLGTTFFTITGTGTLAGNFITTRVTTSATETAFNINNTLGAASDIRILACNFIGAGTVFDAGGLDETSVNLEVFSNANQKNSFTIGSFVVDANVTATTFSGNGVWTDIDFNALAVAGSNIERFSLTNTTTGELTYNGIEDFDGEVRFLAYCISTGGSVNFQCRIVKNGSVLPDTFVPTLDIGSDIKAFTVLVPVVLAQTDTIRAQFLRVSGSSSLTASEASMSIQ